MKYVVKKYGLGLLFLCFVTYIVRGMDMPGQQEPKILPVETEQKEVVEKEKTQKKQRRGYKIRCRGGKCRIKGRRGAAVSPRIQKVAATLEGSQAAQSQEASTFKFVCDKKKCAVKRKGLHRGRGKIRCKDGVCKIKGTRRFGARRQRRLEAYRKQLQARQVGKAATPTTYKLQCNGQKCAIKRKVAGKKWAGRRAYGKRRGSRGR